MHKRESSPLVGCTGASYALWLGAEVWIWPD